MKIIRFMFFKSPFSIVTHKHSIMCEATLPYLFYSVNCVKTSQLGQCDEVKLIVLE